MKDTKCMPGGEAEKFLQILLYLLTQLNQTIESQMEEYRLNKPNQTSQSTYSDNCAPPPLSPDVLSIGKLSDSAPAPLSPDMLSICMLSDSAPAPLSPDVLSIGKLSDSSSAPVSPDVLSIGKLSVA